MESTKKLLELISDLVSLQNTRAIHKVNFISIYQQQITRNSNLEKNTSYNSIKNLGEINVKKKMQKTCTLKTVTLQKIA